MTRASIAAVLVLLSVVGLAGACSHDSSGGGDVCAKLAHAPDCDPSAVDSCRGALSAQKEKTPACDAMLDALASCLGGMEVSCMSGGIAASGSGADSDDRAGGPDNFTEIGGQHVVVGGGCDVEKRGYDACTTCPDAAGATEVGVLGIGERCSSGGTPCATGLSCIDGECTRPCESDADCHARAKDCQLLVQYANVCVSVGGSKRCTASCAFTDDATCQFFFDPSYVCNDKACLPSNPTSVDAGPPDDTGVADTGASDAGAPDVGAVATLENTDATCKNGIDEDHNGFTDCADYTCSQNPYVTVCKTPSGASGGSESTDALCKNGIDDDGDGKTDCADYSCAQSDRVTVCKTSSGAIEGSESTDVLCKNGGDDDGDGFADCQDFSCKFNPALTACR